ncbi:NAD-dependent epimerase/dehydratase family protein [Streptomyces otsuchiensis]|uniref:NAD-dependent epimerase/dehydratase family protein n=1 Tax=Streptomyces otsuchiensis TaxID=2681388 RepID=UPI001032645E|nr:NAD(P)-dependent oxidoreductase [Streptomyces otsuchiensis]
MRPLRVVLTGPTGFVGRAVLGRLLDQRDSGRVAEVRAVTRRVPADRPPAAGVEWWPADLSDAGQLAGAADGADVVIHLACRVDGSPADCERTNVDGTRALIAEARRGGVRRVVQLSTAAVYGPGPHRGIPVDGVVAAPVSAASRTRLAAEGIAREAGATVLRPGLVLGVGDRWVVPALAELRRRVPSGWDGGRGLLSAVAVEDLAALVTTLATGPEQPPEGVHHASHPEPVRAGDLLAALVELDILPAVDGDLPWERCLEQLRRTEGRISERQFALLARDHWYESTAIWRRAGCAPGPGPLHRLAAAAPWYRRELRG